MGKSSPTPPPAPDPIQTSDAQTASNKETAAYNAAINRVDQYSPWGSQTYTQTGVDPNTGAPLYRSDINLSPEQQALYQSQVGQDQQINNIAGGYMNRIQGVMGSPLDVSGLPSLQGSANAPGVMYGFGGGGPIQRNLDFSGAPALPGVNDFGAERQRVEDAQYGRQTAYLDPEYQNKEKQLTSNLANQGIMQGSEAWKNAFDDYNRSKSFDYSQARNDAILAGGNEQSRLFGLGLGARQQAVGERQAQGDFANQAQAQGFGQNQQQGAFYNQAQAQGLSQALQNAGLSNQARQQGISEAAYLRSLPLNEFNALRSASQIQMPQFQNQQPINMQGTDVSGNMWKAFGAQQDAYNQQVGMRNANTTGLYGLGGMLGGAYIRSDARLKKNAKLIGSTRKGLPVYEYSYIWENQPRIGVMAQDVEKVIPAAVISVNGYKSVNYAMVQ